MSAVSVDARLPGTMNFSNVTESQITMTLPEVASNEKEVEYGDFDNDGDLDVVIGNALSDFGLRRNKLYRNDDGVFTEISGAPAIPGFSGSDVTRNAFFRDYDNDGWLDIIVVNDNNTSGDGGRTKVYMNNQVDGVFSHYTEEGVVRLGAGTGGAACGAVSVDVDHDGDYDLYVGNYPGPSQDTMYLNDGSGFFSDVTTTQVPTDGDYTVDVAASDMNGDGKIDLLVSNWNPNYVYYNDNATGSSGMGDYRYTGSQQSLGSAASSENAMEPGDFNDDGMMDFYFSNAPGGDRVMMNIGNDDNNNALFTPVAVPPYLTTATSRKATVADLNNDGRDDILVMTESGRPAVLRNTSVEGGISFVDWSPAGVFVSSGLTGWHGAAFDVDGDGYRDLFLGGWNDDHLLVNAVSKEVAEEEIGGVLTGFHNHDAVAIDGSVSETDVIETAGVPNGATVSLVLNSESDLELAVYDSFDQLVVSSDRGGLGVEEALQFTAPGGGFTIEVTLLAPAIGKDMTTGVGPKNSTGKSGKSGKDGGFSADYILEMVSRN